MKLTLSSKFFRAIGAIAPIHIVQNLTEASFTNHYFIPHWPQP